MKVIREELGDANSASDADDFEEKLKKLKADKTVKEKIHKEIQRFRAAGNYSSESGMIRSYIETVLEMPWDKTGKDNEDIRRAEKVLKQDHYGLTKVKERIIEYLGRPSSYKERRCADSLSCWTSGYRKNIDCPLSSKGA